MNKVTISSRAQLISSSVYSNTILTIVGDIDLTGAGLLTFNNCILKFDGGSISNGRISSSYSRIEADYHVFTNITFSGTFTNEYAKSVWFGCKKFSYSGSQPSASSETSAELNAISAFMTNTNVRKILFAPGTYYINNTIQFTARDIQIIGSNKSDLVGTIFAMGASGKFFFYMQDSQGSPRNFVVKDCSFAGVYSHIPLNPPVQKTGIGIIANYAKSAIIQNCNFEYLNLAIGFIGHTYFSDVTSCHVGNCKYGYLSLEVNNNPLGLDLDEFGIDESLGYPNCNTIRNCEFLSNTHPLNFGNAKNNHILDSDFEANNDSIYLGNYNYITNAHLERVTPESSSSTSPSHIVMGQGCRVCCDIWENGGTFDWTIVANGDNNQISASLYGFFNKVLMAYGKGNTIRIDHRDTFDTCASIIVCDPDDEIIHNGISNKEKTYVRKSVVSAIQQIQKSGSTTDFYGIQETQLSGVNYNYFGILASPDTIQECYISGFFMKYSVSSSENTLSLNLGGKYYRSQGFSTKGDAIATFDKKDKWFQYLVYVPYSPKESSSVVYTHIAYVRQNFTDCPTFLRDVQICNVPPYTGKE